MTHFFPAWDTKKAVAVKQQHNNKLSLFLSAYFWAKGITTKRNLELLALGYSQLCHFDHHVKNRFLLSVHVQTKKFLILKSCPVQCAMLLQLLKILSVLFFGRKL